MFIMNVLESSSEGLTKCAGHEDPKTYELHDGANGNSWASLYAIFGYATSA